MSSVVAPSLPKLGKKKAKFDRRTLSLAPYIQKRKLPKIPASHNLSRKTLKGFPDLGMMQNDVHQDCTCAALGHMEQTWSVYGGVPRQPSDEDVLAAYSLINDGLDEGAAMLDALKMARRYGVGGNKIYGYVSVNPQDHDQVRTAHWLFGGLYVGANLPVIAQTQAVWDVTDGPSGWPGSWGGHAMSVVDYGKETLTVVTWGKLQRMTWAWWDRYIDECFALLEEDFIGPDGKSPQGYSLSKLASDLEAIR